MLVGEVLHTASKKFPNKTALTEDGVRLSYAGLYDRALRLSHHVRARLASPGEVVGILSINCTEYAVSYFGLALAGVISAHLPARAGTRELVHMLALSDAKAILVQAPFLPVLRQALAEAGSSAVVVVIGESEHFDPARDIAFAELLAEVQALAPPPPQDLADPVAITFTSGTTGASKAILASHRARFMSAAGAAIEFRSSENDVFGLTTALSFAAGQGARLSAAIMVGATVVMLHRWNPEAFIAAIEREKVTVTFLVPTQIQDLIAAPTFDPARLASLRTLHYGSATMATSALRKAQKLLPWVDFVESYGQSETGPLTVRHAEREDKLGSVGRPMFMVEIGIFNPAGVALPPGEVGEVATRGGHTMIGYHRNEIATAEACRFGSGWVATGDLGHLDKDGFLTLLGRVDDRINTGGEKYFCQEVEVVLLEHPDVVECVVISFPDERLGEVAAAAVVLKAGSRLSEEDLVAFACERSERHKRPRQLRFVAAIPRTAAGKVSRRFVAGELFSLAAGAARAA